MMASGMGRRGSAASLAGPDTGKSKTGGKSIEELARGAAATEARVLHAVGQDTHGHLPEGEDDLKQMVEQGIISKVEAQKIRARMQVRQVDEKAATEAGEMRIDAGVMAGADYTTTAQMLDDVLDVKRSHALSLFTWAFGLDDFQHRVNKELLRRGNASFKHPFPRINSIVKSTKFDVSIGMIMIVNGVLIGVQVSTAGDIDEGDSAYDVAEHVFTAVFVLEVILRLLADGWLWLLKMSNLMDLLLIFLTGVLTQWILKPAGVDTNALRAFQVLRVLRLVRLVRMVRQVKMFRILWQLIQGVVDSGKTLFWTYVVMGSVLYMFSIMCVYQIGRSDSYEGDSTADDLFGSMPKSLVTLFQTMTLDSWANMARKLGRHQFRAYLVFVISIAILTLILLNLVTAVIVNNAMYRAEKDAELQAQLKNEKKIAEIAELRVIFAEIDEDSSGKLTKDEFDSAVQFNESVRTKLQLLDIQLHESDELWQLLDTGSGEVTIQEFSDLLRAMQGEAKAKDSFSIVQRIRRANRKIERLHTLVEGRRRRVYDLQVQASSLQEELAMVLKDATDFIRYVGKCIPEQPVVHAEEELQWQREKWAVDSIERVVRFVQQAKPASLAELKTLQDELDQALQYNIHAVPRERASALADSADEALRAADESTHARMRQAELEVREAAQRRSGQGRPSG